MHLVILAEILLQIYCIYHVIVTNKSRDWIYVLIIPVFGVIAYFFIKFLPGLRDTGDAEVPTASIINDNPNFDYPVSYITQGKLFHKCEALPVRQIQSHFGQKIVDKATRMNQQNEWKTQSSGSHFGGSVLWGVDNVDSDAIRVFITSVARNKVTDKFYYFLETEAIGGLFEFDSTSNEEKRLFHKENFTAKDLDFNYDSREFVFTQTFKNGTSNLFIAGEDGGGMREVTEGDSIDESPSWVPNRQRCLLFQSSGIARNKSGYAVGRGPASIQILELEDNRLSTVLENERFDFLQPRFGADGFLYFIRRPYEMQEHNPAAVFVDFILFPFRLLRAVFHYLNFFSLVYTKKPLTTASGPKIEGDDLKTFVLKGKVINAEKALRSGVKVGGVPSLVPSTWQLVKRSPDHAEGVIARNVLAFDLDADGRIVYSNGCGIFTLDKENKPVLLLKDNLIEDVRIG